jgi:hypothetical protein
MFRRAPRGVDAALGFVARRAALTRRWVSLRAARR